MIKDKKVVKRTEPEVFRFWDGTKIRGMDSFKLIVKLQENLTHEFQETFKKIEENSKSGETDLSAILKFVGMFRKVFDVAEYEESDGVSNGLTDLQVAKVIKDFMSYVTDKKKGFNVIQI